MSRPPLLFKFQGGECCSSRKAWNRIQERRVDPTEDRRVRSDAERKREYGNGRLSRRLADHPQCILKVLPQGCHTHTSMTFSAAMVTTASHWNAG
jgi:hypothetical protein